MKKELKESKEYIDSDKKDKSKVIKKFNELSKKEQKYINEKKQELIEKELELTNNKIKISDLEYQIKLLNNTLDDLKKSIDLKNKENDELKNIVKEYNKEKIIRSNIITNVNKSYEDLSTPTKIPQIVRKRDDKVRTFAPSDNTIKAIFFKDENLKSMDKYEDINLDSINMLINRIYNETTESDNVVDIADVGNDKKIYFKDLINFLYDIKDGKIDDFNTEMKYEKRLKHTEIKLANRTELSDSTRLYEQYIIILKRELFTPKKSLGRGLTISSFPILLSKIYTNNDSKKLISNIEQIVNNLYNNKQITKQVYNILNKSILYKNDS